MRWFRFYSDALDDPKVQRLPGELFKAQFLAATNGEQNEFSRFLKRGSDRPSAHEWRALRAAVFARDDFTCRYCGERGGRLECDHVTPVSRRCHAGVVQRTPSPTLTTNLNRRLAAMADSIRSPLTVNRFRPRAVLIGRC